MDFQKHQPILISPTSFWQIPDFLCNLFCVLWRMKQHGMAGHHGGGGVVAICEQSALK